MFSQSFILTISITLLVALLRVYHNRHRRFPPGPPPVPLIGNIYGIDTRNPWKTYVRWGKEYGDIIYTRLLTQDIIVINSEKIAQDLLDKRSHNYSSRPSSVSAMLKLLGTDFSSIFLPYGDRWRRHRRIFHQAFHPTAAPSFRPIQLRKVHDLITRLLTRPHDLPAHVNVLSTSIIMAAVYDYDVSSLDDPILRPIHRTMDISLDVLRPEVAAILSAFPFLKYLPAWFPGANFKRSAILVRENIPELVDVPFENVKKKMVSGAAAPSMVLNALSRAQDEGGTDASVEKDLKEACASAYPAAAETSYSTLLVFLLAMTLYPDVQAKAQAEIDSVIGEGLPRLPHWEDRVSLPYVEAIVKETLRWYPVVPLGIPHATIDDDIYEGYYIPRGATVLVNAWAISQDPVKFPEPQKFKPERFLECNSQSVDELSFAFGYGRRVCAGRYVADASLWIAIVSLLAVFRFDAPLSWDPGLDGANVKWAAGLTTRPEEFPCEIIARHKDLSPEKLAHLVGMAEM